MTRLYVHYVAAANWTILGLVFAAGEVIFDGDLEFMLLSVVLAIAIGNAILYARGLFITAENSGAELNDPVNDESDE